MPTALLHKTCRDSLSEFSVLAGAYEQLGPDEAEDQKLAFE